MISEFEEIKKLFYELNKQLNKKINLYVIGGAMLLYHGLKPATKDIDLIVSEKEDYKEFKEALSKAGFEPKILTKEYEHLDISNILVREDFRIDLFHRTVCKGFSLSETMMKRAEKVVTLSNITIFLCSNEDVFLFKTLTERDGDLEDCIALSKKGLDWDAILNELKHQIKLSGNEVWITYVGERLDILAERELQIPIMNDIDILRTAYYDELEKKLKK
ncbi:MAG: DUF6036 family nucleotidyltransferase [Nanoarchaeota archaeon]